MYDITNYFNDDSENDTNLKHYHLRDGTEEFYKIKSHKLAISTLSKYKITDRQLIIKLNIKKNNN